MTTIEKSIKRNLERIGCKYDILDSEHSIFCMDCNCFCVDCDTFDNAGYWTGIDWNQYDAVMKWASSRKTLHVETRLLSDVCYIYIYDRLEYMKAQISMLFRYAESDMFFLSDKNSKSVKESVMDYFYKADRALDYLKICGTEEDVSVYGSKVQQIAEMVESIA